MEKIKSEQWIIADLDNIFSWIEAFILDRKSRNYSPGTIHFYKHKLKKFWQFCQLREITQVKDITAFQIRGFLLWLEENHNAGGQFTFYRAVKTFLKWYQIENDMDDWKNPIDKVKFKQKVVPGDTLIISINLLEPIRRGIAIVFAEIFVGNKLVMEGELMAQIVKTK